ncbi:MAG: bifunctional UDP-sugar hydrolase/5'-nucleotidase [Woeseiaceae bacterium]
MQKFSWTLFYCLALVHLSGCATTQPIPVVVEKNTKTITLLFTNDLESAYEPVPAFWRDDMARIGGIAELTTLINQLRAAEPNSFLFDAGDIFTGTLSKRSQGELAFELMLTMDYDAMCIGNHEFEYGWKTLAAQKNRASFPVLGANLFYRGTENPYAQPYAIIERDGVRIGVIGILGQDAATALIPSNIAGLDVHDPIPVVARYVNELRGQVDLVVLLTHQGKTAPMQTDDEGRPDVQRDIDADMALAGSVDGIDVLLAGHADAGTRKPVVHPDTGTLIMQTFGQGQHLGVLQLQLDRETGDIIGYEGRLIAVDSDALTPDPKVVEKLRRYRDENPDIQAKVGTTQSRMNRQYNRESDLGNLYADIVRRYADAEVGLMPSGALRKDLPEGDIRYVDLLDSFPFEDRVATMTLSGAVLRQLIEQGLSLERGMLQVSGLSIVYDPQAPVGQRSLRILVNGDPLDEARQYRVGTIEIVAAGGDLYSQAKGSLETVYADRSFANVLLDFFRSQSSVGLAPAGRLLPAR